MLDLQVYTHDYEAPSWFLERIRAMPGTLDCRWNAVASRFDVIERGKSGRWDLVLSVKGRYPDQREIRRLERADMLRARSVGEWFEEQVERPNAAIDRAANKAADTFAEDIVNDKIDFIMDTTKGGYCPKVAAGLKEMRNG